ncbi:hypothetical protein ElyMa_005042300 [Elysia marginata]|uniref:Uncharacterized protein n=1 Tax=Elysia marginata TaxID=1093978 RepID=A0AAV4JD40_9GAST|nr:hypothetical protein ElyMa_005042300 [Elysia marginata]
MPTAIPNPTAISPVPGVVEKLRDDLKASKEHNKVLENLLKEEIKKVHQLEITKTNLKVETDQERAAFLWSHLGSDMREEFSCQAVDRSDKNVLLEALPETYSDRQPLSSLKVEECLKSQLTEGQKDEFVKMSIRQHAAINPQASFHELRKRLLMWKPDRDVEPMCSRITSVHKPDHENSLDELMKQLLVKQEQRIEEALEQQAKTINNLTHSVKELESTRGGEAISQGAADQQPYNRARRRRQDVRC